MNINELWKENKYVRFSLTGVMLLIAAWLCFDFVTPDFSEIKEKKNHKIQKVFMPKSTITELERQDIAKVETQLEHLSKIDQQGKINNESYVLDGMQSQIDSLTQNMERYEAELTEWRQGKRTLTRTSYDPNQVRQTRTNANNGNNGTKSTNGANQTTGSNGTTSASSSRVPASPRISGIRSVDADNDYILLANGQTKTLVRANQLVGDGELTEAQKQAKRNQIEAELAVKLAALDNQKDDPSYTITLPSTSMITGTLLSGMQAPTAIGAKRQPVPAVMRIKADALLPNNYRADLDDCQALVSGIGQLSDRRAYLRLVTITCIDEKGLMAEAKAKGIATGHDGQAGVPGELIARNGEVLNGSMWAGFFSGMAQGLSPQRVTGIQVNDEGTGFNTPDLGSIGLSAGLSGTSTALDRIADYYVKMLEEIWPTINVPAFQEVTFFLESPLKLTFKET